jgi:transcriptional regulator with XRE-family HTH domain
MARYRIAILAQHYQPKMSQAKLSRKADVTLSTIRDLWNNKPGVNPTVETLEKIAGALGVPLPALFDTEGEPDGPSAEVR